VSLFVLISRLCAVCFWFSVLVQCLFDSGWKISFEQLHIRSMTMTMTLTSSTLQIQKHEYFGDLNIVIFVGIDILPFYAINMDDVNLFIANFDLYCIDVLYQFEWMNIVYFCKNKKKLYLMCFELNNLINHFIMCLPLSFSYVFFFIYLVEKSFSLFIKYHVGASKDTIGKWVSLLFLCCLV